MAERVAAFTLRIMTAEPVSDEKLSAEVYESLPDFLNDIERQISDQLPEGYYCKIDDH